MQRLRNYRNKFLINIKNIGVVYMKNKRKTNKMTKYIAQPIYKLYKRREH